MANDRRLSRSLNELWECCREFKDREDDGGGDFWAGIGDDLKAELEVARDAPDVGNENETTEANSVVAVTEMVSDQVVKATSIEANSGALEGIEPISKRPSSDKALPATVEDAIMSSGPLLRPIC
jgi:hypothetical protein